MSALFAEILAANERYAEQFALGGISAAAARGLGVLTCIDSRIEPLAMLGLQPGDAKIFRNAGARATDDALRSLVLAANLLNVRSIMIVAHTDCAMANTTDAELRSQLASRYPAVEATGFQAYAAKDQVQTLNADVARIRGCGLLPVGTEVGGFLYDVHDGRLRQLVG